MKRPSISALQSAIRNPLAWLAGVRSQRLFADTLSLAILIPSAVLNVLVVLLVLGKVRPTNFAVPVHYTSLGGFDALGPWYQTYAIAVFSVVVLVVNTLLAALSFPRSRITSFFLMMGAFVVALFCLIIGTAYAGVV